MPARERLTWSLWGTAYALCQGVKLLRIDYDGKKFTYVLSDDDGKATETLTAWRTGDPVVGGRTLLETRGFLLDQMNNYTQNTGVTTDGNSPTTN